MTVALRGQDHLSALAVRGADQVDVQVVGSIIGSCTRTPDPEPVDDGTGAFVEGSSNASPGSTFDVLVRAGRTSCRCAGLAVRRPSPCCRATSVIVTGDVEPYELFEQRLLNAVH